MTSEEMNRTIEFIIASQARLAAAQEQDRRDRIQFEEWSKGLFNQMAETEKQMAETDRQMAETDRQMAETDRQMAETDKRLSELFRRHSELFGQQSELLVHQSRRMDRLDKFYTDWLRQNEDFQRQALHLLNLILDRLPPVSPGSN